MTTEDKASLDQMLAKYPKHVRIGKLGIVRLTGEALTLLRMKCWSRDNETCKACGERVHFSARFAGDPLAYDMAHLKSRGAGGSDLPSNVRTLCHSCHMREHAGKL